MLLFLFVAATTAAKRSEYIQRFVIVMSSPETLNIVITHHNWALHALYSNVLLSDKGPLIPKLSKVGKVTEFLAIIRK